MQVNTKEFLDAVAILTDDRNMRVRMKQSTERALVWGAISIIGVLIMGPVGFLAGGLASYKMTRGRIRLVGDIIRNELTVRQREQLVQHILAAVADFEVFGLAMGLPFFIRNFFMEQAVISSVIKFVTNDMRLQLIS